MIYISALLLGTIELLCLIIGFLVASLQEVWGHAFCLVTI